MKNNIDQLPSHVPITVDLSGNATGVSQFSQIIQTADGVENEIHNDHLERVNLPQNFDNEGEENDAPQN